MKKLIALSLFAAACGDNTGGMSTPDAAPPDSTPDAPPFVAPTPVKLALSTAGTDQLLGAIAIPGGGGGGSGGFYAVGFRSATHESTSDRELIVVKLDGMGALDMAFGGGDGVASLNVQTGGSGEQFRGIVVQPGGKIVVSGVVEDEIVAADRDIALVRFNSDGTIDNTFGPDNNGIARFDLNTGIPNAMGNYQNADTVWGIATDATGNLFLHAGQRTATLDGSNLDTLTDSDFVVMKLTSAGALDTNFASGGKFFLDIQRSSANVRGINGLADGSVVANGYAQSPSLGAGSLVQPVLYKLTPAGVLDTNFATGGLFHEVVLATMTEIYGIAVIDGKFVSAGYGRQTGDSNDWVSLRFTSAGALDMTWADNGKYLLDPTGMAVGDNCRNAIALSDGRVALIGSGGPPNATSDAYVVVLDSTGKPDTKFGSGVMKFDLGSNDAMWGGALATNGKRAMFVGFKGAGATPSATSNDDSYAISLSLE